MATLIARVEEDPEMRQKLLAVLMQDEENPVVSFLREQGKAEGKLEGAMEEARRALLHALERRFGRLSQDLMGRIRNICSLQKLRELHDKALAAPRLETFLKALK